MIDVRAVDLGEYSRSPGNFIDRNRSGISGNFRAKRTGRSCSGPEHLPIPVKLDKSGISHAEEPQRVPGRTEPELADDPRARCREPDGRKHLREIPFEFLNRTAKPAYAFYPYLDITGSQKNREAEHRSRLVQVVLDPATLAGNGISQFLRPDRQAAPGHAALTEIPAP